MKVARDYDASQYLISTGTSQGRRAHQVLCCDKAILWNFLAKNGRGCNWIRNCTRHFATECCTETAGGVRSAGHYRISRFTTFDRGACLETTQKKT
jgi:hypothetical protein